MPKQKVSHFRIIGDVHQTYDEYVRLATDAHYSLQVGDLGFDYRFLTRILDSNVHKAIGGNHENYERGTCFQCPGRTCKLCKGKGWFFANQSKHFLGDYGIYEPPGFCPIFYVRGAWSIDHARRTPGVDWWPDEELGYGEAMQALDLYRVMQPDFVVSHTVPQSIAHMLPANPIFGPVIEQSKTGLLLQAMLESHRPKIWVFGHWHKDWRNTVGGTDFICLNILSCADFQENDPFNPKIVKARFY